MLNTLFQIRTGGKKIKRKPVSLRLQLLNRLRLFLFPSPQGEGLGVRCYPTIIALIAVLHGPGSPLRFTQRSQYQAVLPAFALSNFTTNGDALQVP